MSWLQNTFRGLLFKNVAFNLTIQVLKINGYEITSFTVSEQISFKNSRSGFAVVIASNENFPDKPVRVTFENK